MPYFKSQAKFPPDNYALKIIVGEDFEDHTRNLNGNNPDQETLIKFFHPRCEDCKALAVHMDKLAEDLRGIKNLVIGQYDTS